MKKVISWILFILTISTLAFDVYFAVAGSIDVKNELDRLAATGTGGIDLWGVGIDILIMGIILISAIGLILSVVSAIRAQSRIIRITSYTLFLLFILIMLSLPCALFCR